MSNNSMNLPLREMRTRSAKEKANVEIANYFKPRRKLQTIPEHSVLVAIKQSPKDNNNNNNKESNETHSEDRKTDDQQPKKAVKKLKKTANKTKLNSSKTTTEKEPSMQMKAERTTYVLDDSSASTSSSLEEISNTSATIKKERTTVLDISTAISRKHDFDDLNTDDSTDCGTDDESAGPTFYWSLYNNRKAVVIEQAHTQYKIVDTFFGSEPQTLRSEDIFPRGEPISRRRSTAVWNTPPRYSILPKY